MTTPRRRDIATDKMNSIEELQKFLREEAENALRSRDYLSLMEIIHHARNLQRYQDAIREPGLGERELLALTT